MRRFLTGLTAIVTVVVLIAGCTSSDDTADESTTAPPATTVAPAAAVAATATTTSEVTSATEGVSAEVEEEINALIDAWLMAWNDSDGQAGVDLFTDDGRFVSAGRTAPGVEALDGMSGEVLKDQIERWSGAPAVSSGDPLIMVRDNTLLGRPDSYRVARIFRGGEYGREYLELYNIVDEDGTLVFRYVEGWAGLGWFRLTEDQPYQGNDGGE